MLTLPLENSLTKSLLNGKGQLRLITHHDAWGRLWLHNIPFSRNVDSIAELAFDLDSGEQHLELGQPQNLQLRVSAGAAVDCRLHVIWPPPAGQPPADEASLIERFGLTDLQLEDEIYLALEIGGSANAAAGASLPSGALSVGFEAGVGAEAGLVHLKPYSAELGAREVLEDLLASTRLPQRVDRVAEIPVAGEVLALTYGGYLNLGATLNWGYQITGMESFSPGALDLSLSYLVSAAASLKLGYRVAGRHRIEVRRGHAAGWARYVVNKHRDSSLNFAGALDLHATYDLEGLPETPDEFLGALLGTDVAGGLAALEKARGLGSLEEIEAALDGLAAGFLQDLSRRWLGSALADESLDEFFKVAQDVVAAYEQLDQRLIGLVESYLDRIPELRSTIDDLATLTERDGLVAWVEGELPVGVSDSEAWKLAQQEWGDDFFDLLLDNEAFGDFRRFVLDAQRFLGGELQERITSFVAQLKESLGIGDLIAKLGKIDSPEKLEALADGKIQGFVSRIIGKAFDRLEGSEMERTLARISTFLDNVESFNNRWYGKLQEAAKQAVDLQIAYNYTRTRDEQSLIDVEINLADARGRKLARAATKGDFAGVLTSYDPAVVRVHPGTRLTQNLQRASRIQVNVVGRQYSRAVDTIQDLERSVEIDDGGLVHVYALGTEVDVTRKSYREERRSAFVLQAVGASTQAVGEDVPTDRRQRFLVDTLRRMSVSYDLTLGDRRTTEAELRGYLELARELGLVSSVDDLVNEIRRESPQIGKVDIDYVIRYDEEDLRQLFRVDNTTQLPRAREVARRVVARTFLSARRNSSNFKVGAGYLEGNRDRFVGDPSDASVVVAIPEQFRRGAGGSVTLKAADKRRVRTLFLLEDRFVEAFRKLDRLVDQMVDQNRPIPVDELRKAQLDFAKMTARLDRFSLGDASINCFFVIFDRLIRASSARRPHRKSAMTLTLTPPGGGESEQITKVLVDAGQDPS